MGFALSAIAAPREAAAAVTVQGHLVIDGGGDTFTWDTTVVQTGTQAQRVYGNLIIAAGSAPATGCGGNGQCVSGYCVDGVCCNTACQGACEACNLAGSIGTCTRVPANTTCDDGNSCTTGDKCNNSGVCGGAKAAANTPCDDGNPCTVATVCNSQSACIGSTLAGEWTPCDDGNACTFADRCGTTGTCAGISSLGACPTATDCVSYTPVCDGTPHCDPVYAAAGTPCGGGAQQVWQNGTCATGTRTCDGRGLCL